MSLIAGTPIWTDRGPIPIEQLRIGERVLSKSEATGERAYHKVVRMPSCKRLAIMCIRYCLPPPDDKEAHYHYATAHHPVWVKGSGWTPAYQLEGGEELELHDGRSAYALEVVPVYKTDRPDVGWEPEYTHSTVGFEANFSNGWIWVADRVGEPASLGSKDSHLLVSIYDFELENFHTYYFGELGVWTRGISETADHT